MTIKEMKERKRELGYTYARIAELSGVPLGTVQKIFSGATASPRYDTLIELEKVLGTPDPVSVSESQTSYGVSRQRTYTLEDYYRVPEERRVELIDGVIYDMSSPSSFHQLVAGLIYTKLLTHVLDGKGQCLPMIAPIDVQLDRDNRTMVQPDVVVVCDRDKIIEHCIYGAPDFVIEVLSRSSAKRDSVIKLNKYLSAGVREYWLIDPDRQKVLVYHFEKEEYPIIHSFDAQIPVGIWDDGFAIDFREVYEHVRFLYERS